MKSKHRLSEKIAQSIVMQIEIANEETPADIHEELVQAGAEAYYQSLLDSVGTPSKLRRKIVRLQVWMPSGEPKRYVGTDLADEILPLIKLSTAQAVQGAVKKATKELVERGWSSPELVDETRTNAKKEERERIKDTGATMRLESKDGKPIIMFADGDYYEQDASLTSLLMHLSIVMPHCELPDKLMVIPEQALKGG